MNVFTYELTQDKTMNQWKHTKLLKSPLKTKITTFDAPVNLTEAYLEIEYPVRKEFLENIEETIFAETLNFSQLYCGFENTRVDFSTFITTPHKVSTYLTADLYSSKNQIADFLLTTCGRAVIWLNGEKVCDYQPYTRNHGSSQKIALSLLEGKNQIIIYMDDLAERDINFFLEFRLLSDIIVEVSLPIEYDSKKIEQAIEVLTGLYLEKDYYSEGEILLKSDTQDEIDFNLSFTDPLVIDSIDKYEVGGNITDFSRQDQIVTLEQGKVKIAEVESLRTSGLTKIYIGIRLFENQYLYKKFVFTSYNQAELSEPLGETLKERKQRALKIFSELDLADMNSGIASLHYTHQMTESITRKLQPAYSMIENRGDCADFMFSPLLSYTLMENEYLPEEFLNKIKELALNFRYWIDEPGNDVMWYFSENHSLLFHTCQYLAGYLYLDQVFEVSKRLGKEQYQLGKERLIDWFKQFNEVGFSEWNSTTYLPIDLIGFFSLYNAAPDEEIKNLAKKALDTTFKIIAVNYHGCTLSSTFGRTYEHDLKAMKLGEISNILAIAWDKGSFNYALRAATVFCLSEYEPPTDYLAYIELAEGEYLTANYIQGINQVETYLYKCREYSLSSAIGYNAFQKGHQQHMMNISLGNDGTQLWLNNPGEQMHSGENRPSYWAGNGICPLIHQYKNTIMMKYKLQEAQIKKIHLYLPFWNVSRVDDSNRNWIFIKKGDSYLGVYFSEGYYIEQNGDTRNREVVSVGEEHTVVVKVANQLEVESFEEFKNQLKNAQIERIAFTDYQWGVMNNDSQHLQINNRKILTHANYEINVELENIKWKEGISFGEHKEK